MPTSRRSFLWHLGATAAGAAVATNTGIVQARGSADVRFQAARHAQDDWLDQLPGKHRLFFDTTKPDSLQDAIQFAGNFYDANRGDYKLENSDLAVVVGMRHRSAPFGYNDAIWAKYGGTLSRRAEFTDPKTKGALSINYFTPAAPAPPARARGLASLMRLGVRIAVCNLSTQGIASMIADETGGKADDIYKELAANLIDKARLVPAGIVAMSRAQEKGYAITGG